MTNSRAVVAELLKHYPGLHDQADHGNWANQALSEWIISPQRLRGIVHDSTRQDAQEFARLLASAPPVMQALYRGLHTDSTPKIGDIMGGPRSYSKDLDSAKSFTGGSSPVLIELAPGAHGLDLSSTDKGDWLAQQEVIVGGDVRVTDISRKGKLTIVKVEEVAPFKRRGPKTAPPADSSLQRLPLEGLAPSNEEILAALRGLKAKVVKHPGPDGSEIHATGSDQTIHGGTSRIFHGTLRWEDILRSGFDPSASPVHGRVWGNGGYFTASYDDAAGWQRDSGQVLTALLPDDIKVLTFRSDVSPSEMAHKWWGGTRTGKPDVQYAKEAKGIFLSDQDSDDARTLLQRTFGNAEDPTVDAVLEALDRDYKGINARLKKAVLDMGYDALEILPVRQSTYNYGTAGHQLVIYNESLLRSLDFEPALQPAMAKSKSPSQRRWYMSVPASVWKKLKAKDALAKHAQHNQKDHGNRYGRHWSTSAKVAQNFAGPAGIVLETAHVPLHAFELDLDQHDEFSVMGIDSDEKEVTLRADVAVSIGAVWIGPKVSGNPRGKWGRVKLATPTKADHKKLTYEEADRISLEIDALYGDDPSPGTLYRGIASRRTSIPAFEPPAQEWAAKVLSQISDTSVWKHMGPGDHPSGSSQSVHRGGMSQGTQPTLFGEHHPNPATKLSFRPATAEDYRNAPISNPTFTEDTFYEEEEAILALAVEEFEDAYPGALPSSLTFARFYDGFDATVAFTWSRTAVADKNLNPDLVLVNGAGWENAYENAIDASRTAFIATQILEDDFDPFGEPHDEFAIHTRVIFHELAHIAENQLKIADATRDIIFPQYDNSWFPTRVTASDPSIPSPYATNSPHEFFAEALSDAYYNGDSATPLSKFTAEQLRRVLDGKVDEAIEEAHVRRARAAVAAMLGSK